MGMAQNVLLLGDLIGGTDRLERACGRSERPGQRSGARLTREHASKAPRATIIATARTGTRGKSGNVRPLEPDAVTAVRRISGTSGQFQVFRLLRRLLPLLGQRDHFLFGQAMLAARFSSPSLILTSVRATICAATGRSTL
jgi:hypothetical protein